MIAQTISKLELSALRAVFQTVPAADVAAFRPKWTRVGVEPHNLLPSGAGHEREFSIIVTGYMSLVRYPPKSGRPRCLRILGHGDAVELSQLGGPRQCEPLECAQALTQSVLLATSVRTLLFFCQEHPLAYADLMRAVAAELAVAQMCLARGMSESVPGNLALALLMIASRHGDPEFPDRIPPPLASRSLLAALLGVSVESLYRGMHVLVAEGLVSTEAHKLEIVDRARLMDRACAGDGTFDLPSRRPTRRSSPDS